MVQCLAEMDIEDPNQLLDYLRRQGHLQPEESAAFHRLTGGISNRTVLVQRAGRESWVIKQALEKLRVPTDWFSDPRRIHQEAMGLRCLEKLAPPGSITPLASEDPGHHLLAMKAVPQPHDNWKRLLLAGRLQPGHVEQFGRLLGQIHRKSWEQATQIARLFADRSFFESLRLQPYYAFTAAHVCAARDFLNQLIGTTRQQAVCLVHGDYSPKNILIYRDQLVLLDHEVIHFGDPAFDLGFSLAHLLSKAHCLEMQRGSFASATLLHWTTYREHSGAFCLDSDFEERSVRHTLGCLLARVAGQSRLEYLQADQQSRQKEAVLNLMEAIPKTVAELIARFVNAISCRK